MKNLNHFYVEKYYNSIGVYASDNINEALLDVLEYNHHFSYVFYKCKKPKTRKNMKFIKVTSTDLNEIVIKHPELFDDNMEYNVYLVNSDERIITSDKNFVYSKYAM